MKHSLQAILILGSAIACASAAQAPTPTPTPAPPTATPPPPTATDTPEPTATSLPTSTPTVTPTPTPTEIPVYALAEEGVSANDDWASHIEEFNGVEMALVPAGCFTMGNKDGNIEEQPEFEVCFEEPFWIDVYEVTNEQFGSTGCEAYSSAPDQPRICVNWADALEHCESRDARLPTEAEWEYAARGPDGLLYPWGNEFVEDNTVFGGNSGIKPASVGRRGSITSWIGAFDQAGNVWEWVNDWYNAVYYAGAPSVNPQGPRSGDRRVTRGGSYFGSFPNILSASYRGRAGPISEYADVGFRCARSYEPLDE